MKRHLKKIAWVALVVAFQFVFFRSPWGEALEMRFLDLWFNLRGPVAPPADVVVVAMDEDSYRSLGFSLNQAWPRAAHAKLLHRLADAGARRVVFDVLFFGDGPSAQADDDLAAAMQRVPTVIGADVGLQITPAGTNSQLLMPLEKFRHGTTVALVGVPEDAGRVRRFRAPKEEIAGEIPALASLASASDRQPGSRDFINCYGPLRTIPTYPYYQVLETEKPLPPERLRDKIVMVGLSLNTDLGPAQKDSYQTSFGPVFGVEIHATKTLNLLHNDWIRRASVASESIWLTLMTALVTLFLLSLHPLRGAFVVIGYALAWAAVAHVSFLHGWFVPGATLAVIVLPVAYFGATLSNYLTTRLQQLRFERAFRFYLSPEMAREVAQNPRALELGGSEAVCTALFTDIAGFTNIAETMPPAAVAQMLNAYFTEVMDAIFEQRGTLIKFIGDAVFALWGAPIKTPDHARLCCEAALAIQAEIERFNQSGRFPPLRSRFGIHTGPMLVGNLGSARRFDFTAIGDSVNLASRVEGLNKYFGTTILITDATREQVPAGLPLLKLGMVRVVGKERPMGLHTLFSVPVTAEVAKLWEKACAAFLARAWSAASEQFADIAKAEPRLAKAAGLYQCQLESHQKTSPPAEWQGEIIFTSK